MLIRTYADIEKLEGKDALSAAERMLIENCRIGEPTILGDGSLPERASQERSIRADLLRYLIIGGCAYFKPHERGVAISGAWIHGSLDLSFAFASGALILKQCRLTHLFYARQARFNLLALNGSRIPGMQAEGIVVLSDLLMRDLKCDADLVMRGAQIAGEFSLNGGQLYSAGIALHLGSASIGAHAFLDETNIFGELFFTRAEIGGQLSCKKASVTAKERNALSAECAIIKGGVFLRDMKSYGTLSFSGAEIGGQFSCQSGRFDGGDSHALNLQSTIIKGAVFMDRLQAAGQVTLANADIEGQLVCIGADLHGGKRAALNANSVRIQGGIYLDEVKSTGEISLASADVGGQITFSHANLNGLKGDALNCEGLRLKGLFFWRGLANVSGRVTFTFGNCGGLVDEIESWQLVSNVLLVGLVYENLADPLDISFRKRWLKNGSQFNGQFHPQPYQQLAKFYRETGHRYEAREILVAKEIEQRKATRKAIREGKARTESWLIPDALALLNFLWDGATRLVAGYGYKPWLSLWWLAGLVALMMLAAQRTWDAGDFAPNSAVILTSQDWKTIADGSSQNPAADWTDAHAPGKDYETFYSFAYALDVVVPVLDLGQTDAWAPSPARGDWGYWMFYAQKMFIVAGWVVTAIAAAAISGMIRRDD
ncbi:hypothetical protein [Rhizobium sp. AG855]|uniref:hypothetical protein n=1 Tax=Rhizobium sp. AG855 TaxID=2183898 RepID=UPI000E721C24|nr:hypothetical protein [Rhizobium sp. AG855]RKE85661.1 hypothetical protein DFO46_2462 [Rhizobium sp. AG855]